MASLELRNIVKRYQSDTVLDDVSLGVASGETLVLFGASGAGKTVLLRLVAGVVDPDAGMVLIDDEDVTEVEAEHRAVGMAFQNFALFPHMSAWDNIASPLLARRLGADETKSNVQAVAQLLKIDHVLDHAPRALSNGQKQRTALARALVASPPILLLDDPLRNVDAKLRFEMRLELPKLLAGRGATVIYVTQDYKEAMALGDRIAVMAEGRIVQMGSPEDIYHRPGHIETARLFGDPTINLFDVSVEADADGNFIRLADAVVRIEAAASLSPGQQCVFGVRPEHVRFVDAAGGNAIAVTIAAETPLNEKTVTLAQTGNGQEILISRPAGSPGPAIGQGYIEIDLEFAHLFDRDSGERIEPGQASPNVAGESVDGGQAA